MSENAPLQNRLSERNCKRRTGIELCRQRRRLYVSPEEKRREKVLLQNKGRRVVSMAIIRFSHNGAEQFTTNRFTPWLLVFALG